MCWGARWSFRAPWCGFWLPFGELCGGLRRSGRRVPVCRASLACRPGLAPQPRGPLSAAVPALFGYRPVRPPASSRCWSRLGGALCAVHAFLPAALRLLGCGFSVAVSPLGSFGPRLCPALPCSASVAVRLLGCLGLPPVPVPVPSGGWLQGASPALAPCAFSLPPIFLCLPCLGFLAGWLCVCPVCASLLRLGVCLVWLLLPGEPVCLFGGRFAASLRVLGASRLLRCLGLSLPSLLASVFCFRLVRGCSVCCAPPARSTVCFSPRGAFALLRLRCVSVLPSPPGGLLQGVRRSFSAPWFRGFAPLVVLGFGLRFPGLSLWRPLSFRPRFWLRCLGLSSLPALVPPPLPRPQSWGSWLAVLSLWDLWMLFGPSGTAPKSFLFFLKRQFFPCPLLVFILLCFGMYSIPRLFYWLLPWTWIANDVIVKSTDMSLPFPPANNFGPGRFDAARLLVSTIFPPRPWLCPPPRMGMTGRQPFASRCHCHCHRHHQLGWWAGRSVWFLPKNQLVSVYYAPCILLLRVIYKWFIFTNSMIVGIACHISTTRPARSDAGQI